MAVAVAKKLKKIKNKNVKNNNNETSILLICSKKVESNLYIVPLQPVRITCCRCL